MVLLQHSGIEESLPPPVPQYRGEIQMPVDIKNHVRNEVLNLQLVKEKIISYNVKAFYILESVHPL